ncbi:MAG: 3-deoxy-7-phosphoheptulonate synthase [Planctomycetes bacterium]|nr:3-deoxy-7-phosphoheptulonate synthase [Planctomycetota bacterium]MBI3845791.1 3-deoxy-7-phosphoheptulonate synthase [Planctomycetota bacterium]
MIIVLKPEATKAEVDAILARIASQGLKPLHLPGTEKIVLGAIGDERVLVKLGLEALPYVERVVPILEPYKLAGRQYRAENTVVRVGSVAIGGERPIVIAGPCAIESREQLLATARAVKAAGADLLRGGAYKPRTSPYSFQGLEEEGLKLLEEARAETGLGVVTEVVDPHDVDKVSRSADMLQIGARNMQNFALLKEAGRARKPVLLKRGMSATLEELLMSAEYLLVEGNTDVVLCERGIKTFSSATRNTLDLSIVPLVKSKSHLPIIVDPSHATGIRALVLPMSLAAIAAGADGLIIEVHATPETAQCDGMQQLTPPQFKELMAEVRRLYPVLSVRRS